MDAAILFADILLPLEAMGAELVFAKGDGPTFPHPVRTPRGRRARLRAPEVEETLGYVFDAMRLVRRELDGKVPVIGFGGTPWTLAAYLVEGGGSKHFEHLLAWSYGDPEGLALLLDRIADTSIAYLRGQIAAGAQALQLFDTWGGLLDLERWRRARPAAAAQDRRRRSRGQRAADLLRQRRRPPAAGAARAAGRRAVGRLAAAALRGAAGRRARRSSRGTSIPRPSSRRSPRSSAASPPCSQRARAAATSSTSGTASCRMTPVEHAQGVRRGGEADAGAVNFSTLKDSCSSMNALTVTVRLVAYRTPSLS